MIMVSLFGDTNFGVIIMYTVVMYIVNIDIIIRMVLQIFIHRYCVNCDSNYESYVNVGTNIMVGLQHFPT